MKYRIVKQEDDRYRVEKGLPIGHGYDPLCYIPKGVFDSLYAAECRVNELRTSCPIHGEEVVKVYED